MKYVKWLLKGLFILWLALVAYLAFGYLVDRAHVSLNWCPLKLKRFTQDQMVPVVYGYPSSEMLQDAQSGKITLGGCCPKSWAAMCPFCKGTARFASLIDYPVVPLDDSLKTLSPSERGDVCNYVSNLIRRASAGNMYSEWLTAVTVSSTDIWLGTNGSGLHRFNRENGGWSTVWSNDNPSREGTIRSVRLKGKRVIVEHGTSSGAPFLYRDYTDDRGKTWHRD
ncbi:MAG: hypothetical protein WCK89_18490 [bacterium]